jgi:hypothetical protein
MRTIADLIPLTGRDGDPGRKSDDMSKGGVVFICGERKLASGNLEDCDVPQVGQTITVERNQWGENATHKYRVRAVDRLVHGHTERAGAQIHRARTTVWVQIVRIVTVGPREEREAYEAGRKAAAEGQRRNPFKADGLRHRWWQEGHDGGPPSNAWSGLGAKGGAT